jgi:hypothetical protein
MNVKRCFRLGITNFLLIIELFVIVLQVHFYYNIRGAFNKVKIMHLLKWFM